MFRTLFGCFLRMSTCWKVSSWSPNHRANLIAIHHQHFWVSKSECKRRENKNKLIQPQVCKNNTWNAFTGAKTGLDPVGWVGKSPNKSPKEFWFCLAPTLTVWPSRFVGDGAAGVLPNKSIVGDVWEELFDMPKRSTEGEFLEEPKLAGGILTLSPRRVVGELALKRGSEDSPLPPKPEIR